MEFLIYFLKEADKKGIDVREYRSNLYGDIRIDEVEKMQMRMEPFIDKDISPNGPAGLYKFGGKTPPPDSSFQNEFMELGTHSTRMNLLKEKRKRGSASLGVGENRVFNSDDESLNENYKLLKEDERIHKLQMKKLHKKMSKEEEREQWFLGFNTQFCGTTIVREILEKGLHETGNKESKKGEELKQPTNIVDVEIKIEENSEREKKDEDEIKKEKLEVFNKLKNEIIDRIIEEEETRELNKLLITSIVQKHHEGDLNPRFKKPLEQKPKLS